MTSSTSIYAIQENLPSEQDFQDLFAELDQLTPFDIKKEELAAQLAALLSYADETRSGLARISGWKKSRVTNILNGSGNPTFKTLWEFARHLGYEADLIFRMSNETPANQPWQCRKKYTYQDHGIESQYFPIIRIQTAEEVASDIVNGKNEDHYYSIPTNPSIMSLWNQVEVLTNNSVPTLTKLLVEIE